jgi:hypothetical protein
VTAIRSRVASLLLQQLDDAELGQRLYSALLQARDATLAANSAPVSVKRKAR